MSRDYPVSGTKYKIQFDDLFVSQITIIYWFRVLSSAVRWQPIGLPWLFLVIVHRKFHWDCPLDWLSGWTVTGFVIGQSPEISTNFQFSRVDSDGCPAGVHRKMWGSVKTSLFLVHFFFFQLSLYQHCNFIQYSCVNGCWMSIFTRWSHCIKAPTLTFWWIDSCSNSLRVLGVPWWGYPQRRNFAPSKTNISGRKRSRRSCQLRITVLKWLTLKTIKVIPKLYFLAVNDDILSILVSILVGTCAYSCDKEVLVYSLILVNFDSWVRVTHGNKLTESKY